MPQATKRFLVLDSYRGICALCVVIFHMSFSSGISEIEFFMQSNAFVDFFFVLSGFVLTHAYAGDSGLTFRKYMISRIFRIAPLHLFLLAIFLVLEIIVFFAYQYGLDIHGEPFSGKNSIVEIIPNVLLVHAWTDFTRHLSFNGPSWSISVEFFLYIVFFFTLLVKIRTIAWIVISLIAGYFFIIGLAPINDYLFRGLFSFFLGATTYTIYQKNQDIDLTLPLASFIEISLVICLFIVITLDSQHRFLFSGAFFTLIVYFFAFENGVLSKLFRSKLFVYIGILSYSIYMTHYLVLSVFKASVLVISKVFSVSLISQGEKMKSIDLGSPLYNSFAAFVIVGAVIFLSTFTYRGVERKAITVGRTIQ